MSIVKQRAQLCSHCPEKSTQIKRGLHSADNTAMDKSGLCVDCVLIAFLILHTFLGWRRGLLWQAAGVASLGLGVALGLALAPSIGVYVLRSVTSDPFRAKLVAFLFVFGLVGFALRMSTAWIEVHSEKNLLKEERDRRRAKDRILGGAFGAIKGLLVAAIAVAACVSFFPKSDLWTRSHLAGSLATAGSRLLPEGAVNEVRNWARQHVTSISQNLEIH